MGPEEKVNYKAFVDVDGEEKEITGEIIEPQIIHKCAYKGCEKEGTIQGTVLIMGPRFVDVQVCKTHSEHKSFFQF